MAEKSWWESITDTVGGTLSDVIGASSELAEKWASWNIAESLGFEAASQVSETPSGGSTSWKPVGNSGGVSSNAGGASSVPAWMWAVGAAALVLVLMPSRGR